MDEALHSILKEKTALWKAEYKRCEEDAFLSVLWASKLQMLEELQARLDKGEAAPVLLAELKEKLPALEQEREREAEYPSFDWYDEHYHYKVLSGQCEACAEMIQILEEQTCQGG